LNQIVPCKKNWSSGGLRFLIVDDTKTNRKMTRKLLSSLGHFVDEAEDGIAFLNMLRLNSSLDVNKSVEIETDPVNLYDVILMDDNMPNLCGPEATLRARKCGYTGLIFGVTGNTHQDQIQNFLNSGANQVFEKPLNMEKLKISFEKMSSNLG
jgi:CheY-like chemotaxis protein